MARSSTDPLALRDAFVWTPGDGHRYLWDGASPEATVQRVVPRGAGIDLVDTGDRVPMVGVARTVTAFTAAVTAWRVTQVTAFKLGLAVGWIMVGLVIIASFMI